MSGSCEGSRSLLSHSETLFQVSATPRNRGRQNDRHELLTDGDIHVLHSPRHNRPTTARCLGHATCRQGNQTPPRASYRSSSASLNMPGFLVPELSGLTGEESSVARVCWKESGRESLVVSRRLAFPCKPCRSYDCVAYPRCGYWK